ncbi:DUF1311 domain-containing protein [Rhodobacteraceae bacterium RKSG542]|uniref:lysozyme inhibitor LprI family protein n=1 Tax=Pseudovibrio flavus TaxID=2529854 RepID=UPI0012BD3B39|nr:lysozyme inhibitor LprI family protein [Pseudovibrio flavus]MTI19331.1 DUF1311 domain-containing protein [Pseudovibrio flavus]
MLFRVCAACLILAGTTTGLWATNLNQPGPKEKDVFEACLNEANGDRFNSYNCIGKVIEICQAANKTPSVDSISTCIKLEDDLWTQRMDSAYERLVEGASDEVKADLDELQQKWGNFRDMNCKLMEALLADEAARPVGKLQCLNRLKAIHAINLEQMGTK